MDLANYLFKEACLRCENHAKNMECEDKKEWETPPTPINEII